MAASGAATAATGVTLRGLGGMQLSETMISPQDARTGIKLDSDGTLYYLDSATRSGGMSAWGSLGTWLLSGANTDYEVRVTKNSGSALTTGTVGTWQVLSTDREFLYTITTNGFVQKIGNFTVEVRRVSDSVVVASATFDMECAVEV